MRSSAELVDVDRLRAEFDAWRRRTPRHPFPDRMWRAAYELLSRYPTTRVCRELGLNATRLRRKGQALAAGRPALAVPPTFFELPPVVARGAGATEVGEHRSRWRMTVEGSVSVTLLVDEEGWRIELTGRTGSSGS